MLDHRSLLRRHAVAPDGAVLFSLTEIAPRCAGRVVAGEPGPVLQLVGVDVSPVPGPDRVRGSVRLSGPVEVLPEPHREDLRAHLGLGPGDVVGRLVPEDVTLDWHVETGGRPTSVPIGRGAYAAAGVDPLAGWEAGWVAHLAADHDDVLRALVAARGLSTDGARVRPVLADELGLVLRVERDGRGQDVRVPFARRVECGCEAVRALAALTGTLPQS